MAKSKGGSKGGAGGGGGSGDDSNGGAGGDGGSGAGFLEERIGFDTLLSDSSIWLFGREMYDLTLAKSEEERRRRYKGPSELELKQSPRKFRNMPRNSRNSFLMDQLSGGASGDAPATLARIYSFSYQNELHDLMKPAIFLVHGVGVDIEQAQFGPFQEQINRSSLAQRAAYTERSGVSSQGQDFARGMRAWVYDRADFSIRLDVETGTLDRVLLGIEFGDPHFGDHTRMAGGDSGPPPPPPAPGGLGRRARRRRFKDDY